MLASTVCAGVTGPVMMEPFTVSALDAAITATLATVTVGVVATETMPARADLPVIDISSVTEEIASFVQQLKGYVVDVNNWLADLNSYFTEEEQLATQIKQLTTMLDQYTEIVFMAVNFIHNPSLGAAFGILEMAGLRLDSLPLNVYALSGLMSGYKSGAFLSNWQGIPGQLSSLFNTSSSNDQVYRCSDASFKCKQQQEKADAASGYKSVAGQVYTDIQNHNTALNALRDTANSASDPKTVQDVTAQAAIENAWSTNNATRMLSIIGIGQAQADIIRSQGEQKAKQQADEFLAAVP